MLVFSTRDKDGEAGVRGSCKRVVVLNSTTLEIPTKEKWAIKIKSLSHVDFIYHLLFTIYFVRRRNSSCWSCSAAGGKLWERMMVYSMGLSQYPKEAYPLESGHGGGSGSSDETHVFKGF